MNLLPDTDSAIPRVLQEIADLPEDFHVAGVTGGAVLEAITDHSEGLEILRSAEHGVASRCSCFPESARTTRFSPFRITEIFPAKAITG